MHTWPSSALSQRAKLPALPLPLRFLGAPCRCQHRVSLDTDPMPHLLLLNLFTTLGHRTPLEDWLRDTLLAPARPLQLPSCSSEFLRSKLPPPLPHSPLNLYGIASREPAESGGSSCRTAPAPLHSWPRPPRMLPRMMTFYRTPRTPLFSTVNLRMTISLLILGTAKLHPWGHRVNRHHPRWIDHISLSMQEHPLVIFSHLSRAPRHSG